MTLKVGDICEVIRSVIPDIVPVGAIVTICEPSPLYDPPPFGHVVIMAVDWVAPNGEYIFAGDPKDLRKLPPKQGTTTWEHVQETTGWVPNKQGVES